MFCQKRKQMFQLFKKYDIIKERIEKEYIDVRRFNLKTNRNPKIY